MKACIITGPGRTEVADIPIPQVGDDEVLVKVSICGVCTSEIHPWLEGKGGVNGVLGHEPVGIIEALGKNVTGFSIGDRVTGLMWGAFAEYTAANYRNLVKVPDNLSDIEALGEPLSCLVSGANRTQLCLSDTAAAIGMGFMGLGFMQLLKIKGAGRIIAIDVRQESLDKALRFGADEVYLPNEVPEKYKVTEWEHIGLERGCNIVAEVSGSPKGLDLAGDMTGVHGVLSIVGWHQNGHRSVNMELWNWKGITVINAHERRNNVHVECMKAGLRLIDAGLFNMRDMITHKFRLDELDMAFEVMRNKPDGFIKAVLKV